MQPREPVLNTQSTSHLDCTQVTFNHFQSPIRSLFSATFIPCLVSWLLFVFIAQHWSHILQKPPLCGLGSFAKPNHSSCIHLWVSFFFLFTFHYIFATRARVRVLLRVGDWHSYNVPRNFTTKLLTILLLSHAQVPLERHYELSRVNYTLMAVGYCILWLHQEYDYWHISGW